MMARALLPLYGGTPAVWTICSLFFQALLLSAYGYAYWISRLRKPLLWRLLHVLLVLFSVPALPLSMPLPSTDLVPELAILKSLTFQCGLPLLVIGASAPLLQFAYSQTKAKNRQDPYFLYVASNIGSLIALLLYPFLIERFWGLKQQFLYWNSAFIGYLFLLVGVFFVFTYHTEFKERSVTKTNYWYQNLQWIFLSFIPCSLMLSVTFYISTDFAAMPLLWILPLALYLLSFIITFAQKPLISPTWVKRNALLFLSFPVIGFILRDHFFEGWQLIFFHLINFFIFALLIHNELVERRPQSTELTRFYFCLAFGGVLAGIANGLVAPRIFSNAYEYPLGLVLAVGCIPLPKNWRLPLMPFVVLSLLLLNYFLPNQAWLGWIKSYHLLELFALTAMVLWPSNRLNLVMGLSILFIFIFGPWFKQDTILLQKRNFYGIKQVSVKDNLHLLMSQSTLHGFQDRSVPAIANREMAYYEPMWSVVRGLQQFHDTLQVKVIGLGTGMTACQFRKRDHVTMIDIDGQVIQIANNPSMFSYLRDCPASVKLVQGDGRIELTRSQNMHTDLLVIDAFSSDAIPSHLLTLEAFELYYQKITVNGAILVHISNRFLRLLPVITANARTLEMLVLKKVTSGNTKTGQLPSEWVLLTMNETLANELLRNSGWRFVADRESLLWTDDYVNILPLLK